MLDTVSHNSDVQQFRVNIVKRPTFWHYRNRVQEIFSLFLITFFTEKAAVYLVNCSRSSTVCKHQHVQGFPSVKLFRSVAWSQFGGCATDHIQQQYIALDYHRPLEVLDPQALNINVAVVYI